MHEETLEGYVVDIACLRKYSREDLARRAREHSLSCLLMGHCVESGYGLVDESGGVSLLDSEATAEVVRAAKGLSDGEGIRLRVFRAEEDGEMKTRVVTVVSSHPIDS